jgi:hypothetical protein
MGSHYVSAVPRIIVKGPSIPHCRVDANSGRALDEEAPFVTSRMPTGLNSYDRCREARWLDR